MIKSITSTAINLPDFKKLWFKLMLKKVAVLLMDARNQTRFTTNQCELKYNKLNGENQMFILLLLERDTTDVNTLIRGMQLVLLQNIFHRSEGEGRQMSVQTLTIQRITRLQHSVQDEDQALSQERRSQNDYGLHPAQSSQTKDTTKSTISSFI